VEAAWWVAAAASFAPVSQIFPFLNPVADRYLYFILPGLIGGTLCAGLELRGRLPASAWRGAAAAAVALSVLFAVQSAARAELWRGELFLLVDAAKHYPEGGTASFLRAREFAQKRDVEAAVAELRRASERGIDRFMALEGDPGLAPIRSEPAFRELLRELAGRWIETAQRRGLRTQAELRMLALAHLQRDELDQALAAFERALEVGGPLEPVVRAELEGARARRLRQEAAAGGRGKEGGHRAQSP
jgi:tetratricopeptide (TPR) repeat protein